MAVLSWIKDIGLDTDTGIGYTGGEDKYISALGRFYKNYEKNKIKVTEFYGAKDYESYMITVHALKSNAKMIGAMELSRDFEMLENATRNNEIAVIEEYTTPVMMKYGKLIELLSPLAEMGETKAADEISADEAREVADRLFAALDDFDDETSKTLASKLTGYPFRPTQADKLKEAIAQIDDFMYDEAAELIKEIYPTIE